MAVNTLRLAFQPHNNAPVFAGSRKLSVPQQGRVQSCVDSFKQELETLQQWDQSSHSQPVFKKLDIPAVVKQAKNFLSRQYGDPSQPVPFLIGLAGGSASGKTFVNSMLNRLIPPLAEQNVNWRQEHNGPVSDGFTLDSFYKASLYQRRQKLGDVEYFAQTNLDEPKALNMDQVFKTVMRLKNGAAVRIPFYDMRTSKRYEGSDLKAPTPFVFVEGLFALVPKNLRKLYDLKIFVDADEKTRVERFWKRAPERNLNAQTGQSLLNKVLKMHDLHIEPSKAEADVVIDGASRQEELQDTLSRFSRILLKAFYPPNIGSPTNPV